MKVKPFLAVAMAGAIAVSALRLQVFAQGDDWPDWLDIPGEDIQVQAIPGTSSQAVGADAAIVMEATTGRILFEQDIDERLPIASTTKIMTAMLALEQPDLDLEFEVDADAIKVEGSSMGLQEGDIVTLRALAIGMLLASGNDAAGAAGVRISGSTQSFVSAMNQRAQTLGMTNTSFETPSGLDGENHYSTARDMATLTREALQNPEFVAICSQYRMRTSYGNPPYDRWLTNHNKLLNYVDGAIGVKTGFTKKAGRCLVSAAQRDGVTLIIVTLGCPNDWQVHQNLYDRYFGTVEIEDLSANIPETIIPVTGGTKAEVAVSYYDKVQVPVPVSGAEVAYKVKVPQFLYAPVKSGQAVGEVEIYLDDELIHRLSLIAAEDIPLLHEYEEKWSFTEWLAGLFERDT